MITTVRYSGRGTIYLLVCQCGHNSCWLVWSDVRADDRCLSFGVGGKTKIRHQRKKDVMSHPDEGVHEKLHRYIMQLHLHMSVSRPWERSERRSLGFSMDNVVVHKVDFCIAGEGSIPYSQSPWNWLTIGQVRLVESKQYMKSIYQSTVHIVCMCIFFILCVELLALIPKEELLHTAHQHTSSTLLLILRQVLWLTLPIQWENVGRGLRMSQCTMAHVC